MIKRKASKKPRDRAGAYSTEIIQTAGGFVGLIHRNFTPQSKKPSMTEIYRTASMMCERNVKRAINRQLEKINYMNEIRPAIKLLALD